MEKSSEQFKHKVMDNVIALNRRSFFESKLELTVGSKKDVKLILASIKIDQFDSYLEQGKSLGEALKLANITATELLKWLESVRLKGKKLRELFVDDPKEDQLKYEQFRNPAIEFLALLQAIKMMKTGVALDDLLKNLQIDRGFFDFWRAELATFNDLVNRYYPEEYKV